MKIPLSWLRDYITWTIPTAELAERLTLAGLELEAVHTIGQPVPDGMRVKQDDAGIAWDPDKVLIGQIEAVAQHPDADRLTLPTVSFGKGQTKKLVTGAPNIKVGDSGQKVVVALTGAVLIDGYSEERVTKKLKPTKIRGIPSDAMVCSLKELGIADDHEGIIILDDDAPVGTPLADYMGDVVLEFDVLPNMARCLSMIGMAREVAAITGESLKIPESKIPACGLAAADYVDVKIENENLSRRYAAAIIQNVTVGPSPSWMQRRLTYAGMRPINNIVDITNYVLFEWGQPLHAFDYDLLVKRAGGGKPVITVRPAKDGEEIVTLDDQKRKLTPENLVIADEKGPIALAGVMGGADTEVHAGTKNVLLESANFDFVSIRRTMHAMNLPSESSIRFSKGIHPESVKPAAERAAVLMAEHAGGTVCDGLVDSYPAPIPPQKVKLSMREVSRALGVDIPKDEAVRVLRALEYDVTETGGDELEATVPPHRLDIQVGAADLIEDLARIYGYDHLPSTLISDQLPKQHRNVDLEFEEHVRDLLVDYGLQEVVTYSLTTPEREAPVEADGKDRDYVTLVNPISSERTSMRRTVLAGVLDVVAANLRHTHDVRVFEIGPVFLPKPGEKLPEEPRRLSIVMTGHRTVEFWADENKKAKPAALDFFDIKGVVEALAEDLHLPNVTYESAKTPYLHPGKSAILVVDGKPIGEFGEMHPKVAATMDLPEQPILVGDFDLETLQQNAPSRFTYSSVPRFPAALRDIAIVVSEDVTAEQLTSEIRAGGGKLLRDVHLFDVYRGSSIPEGTKSLAYALSYQADDRTLTDKEVDKAHRKIEERLKRTLKAQIRGKE